MEKNLLFLVFICFFFACVSPAAQQEKANKNTAPDLRIIDSYSELVPLLQQQNDTTYVINFWATWCKPCVKELPYFEQLHNTYLENKVNVVLISLDFPDQIEQKLIPFIKDRQLKSTLIAFTDSDMNSWIPRISKDWSGAIPATLVYKNSKRAFYEQSFESFEELNNIIKSFTTLEQ